MGHKAQETCLCDPTWQPPAHKVVSLLFCRPQFLSRVPSHDGDRRFQIKVASQQRKVRKEYIRVQGQNQVKSTRLDLETMVGPFLIFSTAPIHLVSRRHLGGRFPPSIEIRCPILDARIRVDIPDFDARVTAKYGVFSKEHVVDLCKRSLRTVREYEWLVQTAIDEGSTLELAWRMGAKLDWVYQTDDVEGQARDWAVLCGLSLKQVTCFVFFSLINSWSLTSFLYRVANLRIWKYGSSDIILCDFTFEMAHV